MNSLHVMEAPVQACPGLCLIQDSSGLTTLEVDNVHATATIAMQGAHIMRWQPKHVPDPVLWVSQKARHVHGRSIRGGVPVCWPWFGAHASDNSLCPHGFARVMPWHLVEATQLENGATRLVLQIIDTPVAQKQLPYPYELRLTMVIGETLQMALATSNKGDTTFLIGEALHTYFQISDIEKVSISGLAGFEYADKVQGFSRSIQHGAIQFDQEFDRVYLNTASDCVIEDEGLGRRIRIAKSGSLSTVVWTPWQDKAWQMADMGDGDDWRHMICVESANAMDNIVSIAAGETHVLAVEYRVDSW